MLKSVLIAPPGLREDVFSEATLAKIRTETRWLDADFPWSAADSYLSQLAETEVIFSTWGMPKMDEAFLAKTPNLRAVFYAAGSVRGFVTEAFWNRGITLSSAWRSNAIPVSEYALGAILLSLKQTWLYHRRLKVEKIMGERLRTQGGYGSTVGLVSLGAIGWRMVELLKPFSVQIIAFDPFVEPAQAAEAGVTLVELEELFDRSDVVSLHTPWLKETENLIHGDLLRRMKPNSTLINTARGAVVDEAALIDVLGERPDLTAFLDVTHPEPASPDSPLYTLPNVLLTPHIAGSVCQECQRMGDSMLSEYHHFIRGEALEHEVTRETASRMA